MGDNPFLLWLSVVPLLVAVEALKPQRWLVFLVPAVLVGAACALMVPTWWWLQILLAAGVAIVSVRWVRPRFIH